jgi:hypothetical protein
VAANPAAFNANGMLLNEAPPGANPKGARQRARTEYPMRAVG